MKIEPTSLVADAQKLTGITQNFYQTKKNIIQGSSSALIARGDTLKQQLVSIQSNISAYQTYEEGLKEIEKELISLSKNNKNWDDFYKKIYEISKKFSYNEKNVIAEEYLKPFYNQSVIREDLTFLLEHVKDSILQLQDKIKNEKKEWQKLEIGSENMRAVSSMDRDLFKDLKKVLDEAGALKNKIHVLTTKYDQIGHLLS